MSGFHHHSQAGTPMIDLAGTHLAVPTPFDPVTEEVDREGFVHNLESWFAEPVSGVLVGGSTGESVLLDADERDALVRDARSVAGPDRIVVAGATGESTRSAITAVVSVARAGADAALVSPPAYYRDAMTRPALLAHYGSVAEAAPIPILVYQVPLRLSTIEFPTSVVAELSTLPNVVGIKDSRGDLGKATELVSACGDGFQVLVGSGSILLPALKAGAVGGIVAVGAFAPVLAAAVSNSFRTGGLEEAERAQALVTALHDAVVAGMGVPGVKAALDLVGMVGGAPRRPLGPLAAPRKVALKALLEAAGVVGRTVGSRA